MADGNLMTYAQTQGGGIETQYLNNNTIDIGPFLSLQAEIQIVETRAYAIIGSPTNTLSLTPYFDGTDAGQSYVTDATTGFTSWANITNDPNAPNPWSWYDATSIDMLVTADVGDATSKVSVSIVQVRVTYAYGASSSSQSSSSYSSSSSSSSSLSSSSSSSSESSSSNSSSSLSSSSSGAIYSCEDNEDCGDAWYWDAHYGCDNSPNIVTNMCEVDIGDCVEFNHGNNLTGGERIWGIVIDQRSCSFIVRVITDLKFVHPFEKYDRVEIELKHIYNVDKDCSNF